MPVRKLGKRHFALSIRLRTTEDSLNTGLPGTVISDIFALSMLHSSMTILNPLHGKWVV